ncbi:MAG: hypothetical protein DPW11_03210 [bacterium]|nr:hypothetical protein [Anaerolineales bacterium]MCQ3944757.1 hypothetical protein [bacterium]
MKVGPGESPHIRRLRADYESMLELKGRSALIDFEVVEQRPGMPPEKYIVSYGCRGIASIDASGNPEYSYLHKVAIYLHQQYPNRAPGLKWLTPIWHPNIHHATKDVCIDATWWAASRSLDMLVIMIGEMVKYKNYHDENIPPFPLDKEAASWSREYRRKHADCFPVDDRELLRPQRIGLKLTSDQKKPPIRLKQP